MDCKQRLQAYFREHDVSFETVTHSEAYTAQEVAAALHVSGHQLAKVVMVWAGDELTMTVVPASGRVDLRQAAEVLGADDLAQNLEPLLDGDVHFTSFPDEPRGGNPGGVDGSAVARQPRPQSSGGPRPR